MATAGGDPTRHSRSYGAVHSALRRRYGSAIGRPCAAPGCDAPATGHALIGRATHIGVDSHGKRVKWSTDLDAYAPTCTSHNGQRDHGGSWTMCKHGHVRLAWGVTAKGYCRGCVRQRPRRRSAA